MAFQDSYAAAAACWPAGTTALDVPTSWGRTHVLAAGPDDGERVVLLHGDGATATAWAEVAGALAGRYRVLAPDLPGNPGFSTSSRAFRTTADQVAWLVELVGGLAGPRRVHLAGHSAGAHLALSAALASDVRVASLTLFDPTSCFAGLSPRYVVRALPMLLRPTPRRVREFLAWETRGRQLDPAWTAVFVDGATEVDRTPVVRTKRPPRARLADLRVPTQVVLAGAGRAHDTRRVARSAAAVLPDGSVAEVPDATHHTMPVLDADRLATLLAGHASAHPAG